MGNVKLPARVTRKQNRWILLSKLHLLVIHKIHEEKVSLSQAPSTSSLDSRGDKTEGGFKKGLICRKIFFINYSKVCTVNT
jgi:hypothetical protein